MPGSTIRFDNRAREPVNLTVSQLAKAISQAAQQENVSREPGWSTALTGTIFHEVAEELLRAEGAASWQRVLDADTVRDSERLLRHVYSNLLGPRLTDRSAALQSQSAAVLNLWIAARELCRAVCELLDSAQQRGILRYSTEHLAWQGADTLFLTEAPLLWELRKDENAAPIVIRGVADAIWRHPEDGSWCVLELKTARRSPETELAQACLYRRMIGATRPDWGGRSSIAIVRFAPRLETMTFSADQLRDAEEALEALAVRLAGRTSAEAPSPETARRFAQHSAPTPEHEELARRVVATLRQYGCEVALAGDLVAGAAYVRVPLSPGRGASVKAIQNQVENLHVQLSLAKPPMIHIVEGSLVVDLERPDRQIVRFANIESSLQPRDPLLGNSRAVLGVGLGGDVRYVDLSDDNTSHILVAGTPGSGKSEWLRSALASLLLTNTPETLRLVLIDPKHTAFGELRSSPFLWKKNSLVLPPDGIAEDALDELIEEMERRYKLMERHRCDKLAELVRVLGQPVPRIVCVCDEFADLLQADRRQGKAVEQRIRRLGAKARAAGIHLILATQHPNRDVISGALKTTLGGRVCLRTASHVQSHLMSTPDAEKLLGGGDLLFLDVGQPVRLQAPLLGREERARIFAGE